MATTIDLNPIWDKKLRKKEYEMAALQVSAQKVIVNFECEKCEKQVSMSLIDLIDDGAPICCEGDQMDFVDCEIDTQMHFG